MINLGTSLTPYLDTWELLTRDLCIIILRDTGKKPQGNYVSDEVTELFATSLWVRIGRY